MYQVPLETGLRPQKVLSTPKSQSHLWDALKAPVTAPYSVAPPTACAVTLALRKGKQCAFQPRHTTIQEQQPTDGVTHPLFWDRTPSVPSVGSTWRTFSWQKWVPSYPVLLRKPVKSLALKLFANSREVWWGRRNSLSLMIVIKCLGAARGLAIPQTPQSSPGEGNPANQKNFPSVKPISRRLGFPLPLTRRLMVQFAAASSAGGIPSLSPVIYPWAGLRTCG